MKSHLVAKCPLSATCSDFRFAWLRECLGMWAQLGLIVADLCVCQIVLPRTTEIRVLTCVADVKIQSCPTKELVAGQNEQTHAETARLVHKSVWKLQARCVKGYRFVWAWVNRGSVLEHMVLFLLALAGKMSSPHVA